VVLLTIERVTSVWLPLKCKELCSRRRIVRIWFGIIIVMIIVNCNFFFTHDIFYISDDGRTVSRKLICLYLVQYTYFCVEQWYWIDASVRLFAPFIFIISGNVLIVVRIVVASRQRRVQMRAAGGKNDEIKGAKVRVRNNE
jgi:hypothetical protein